MRAVVGLVTAILVALVPASAIAADEHSRNMSLIKNFPYQARNGDVPNFGTDIEFATINGRRYALAGSYRNGMQIFDITTPSAPRRVAVYDCGITQGDVQVFRQSDKPGRVFAGYTSDTYGDGTSPCYRQAAALGFNVKKPTGEGKNGTFILEVTNPAAPKTVSFVEVEQGSHNHSIHPNGRYLYNSNSDLMTSFQPAIEVFDIRNFAAPVKVTELSIPTRPGLGTESHDITFSNNGARAYSAALSQGVVIDTTTPRAPKVVSSWLDPAINVWHQADPFNVNGRSFVLVEDEFAGAAGGPVCPSGGFHIYETTGEMEKAPQKVGYWNIDDVGPTHDPAGTCTAHVFDIHERQQIMTVAYYNGGVRVVDLSGLDGGEGLRQIGYYKTENADSWSAKTPVIEPNGSFYLYGNDIARGLDVYRFDATKPRSDSGGTWLGAQAALSLPAAPRTGTNYVCLIQQ
jgi:hypothetical protein